jgi:hypothetical protein
MYRLRVALRSLSQKRDALQFFFRRARVSFVTDSTFSPRIIVEIFLLCRPGRWEDYGGHLIPYRRAFMLPTQICGHWRRVAIMTPRLWASFVQPLAYKPRIEPDVALAKTWLSRAGQCPLSLHIEVMWTDDVLSMIDAILLHCESWQHIKFVMPTDLIAHLAVARHHLPLLETPSLQTGQIDYGSSRKLDIFEFAPMLRCLRLKLGCPLDEIYIPWTQLGQCSIDYADPEQCLYILARSPTLVNSKPA